MGTDTTIRVTFRRRPSAHVRKRERQLRATPGVTTVAEGLAWARASLQKTTPRLAGEVVAVLVELVSPNGKGKM